MLLKAYASSEGSREAAQKCSLVRAFAARENTTGFNHNKTCYKRPLKRRPNISFQDRLLLNTGQKFCRMRQESILQYFDLRQAAIYL